MARRASDGPADGRPIARESSKRRQILQGAREVFLAQGFDGASMGEIARASGVSKGTLYVYFDSKDKLFEVLTLEEKKSPRGSPVQARRRKSGRAGRTDRARRLLPEVHGRCPTMSPRCGWSSAPPRSFPRIGQTFYEAGPQRGIERLSAYLARQAEAGRLSISDPDMAAGHFLALCQAETMKRLLFAVDTELDPAEIDNRVREALRVFFAAYGPNAARAR